MFRRSFDGKLVKIRFYIAVLGNELPNSFEIKNYKQNDSEYAKLNF